MEFYLPSVTVVQCIDYGVQKKIYATIKNRDFNEFLRLVTDITDPYYIRNIYKYILEQDEIDIYMMRALFSQNVLDVIDKIEFVHMAVNINFRHNAIISFWLDFLNPDECDDAGVSLLRRIFSMTAQIILTSSDNDTFIYPAKNLLNAAKITCQLVIDYTCKYGRYYHRDQDMFSNVYGILGITNKINDICRTCFTNARKKYMPPRIFSHIALPKDIINYLCLFD